MGDTLSNDQIVCLVGAAIGLAMLAFGFWRRHEAAHLKAFPLQPASQIRLGTPASVSGTIQGVSTMGSPLQGKTCVFSRVLTERQEVQTYYVKSERKTRHVWKTIRDAADGGFFVSDGAGLALIVPTLACLDLDRGGVTQSDAGLLGSDAERRTEWILEPGQTACAAGIPQGPEAFIAALTGRATMSVSPGILAKVRELAAAGQQIPCYFLESVDTVADRSYEAAVKFYEDSGNTFIQYGGICAGASLLFLAMFHFKVF